MLMPAVNFAHGFVILRKNLGLNLKIISSQTASPRARGAG